MSIEKVRAYFRPLGREGDILEFPVSSATVELAAQAVGVAKPKFVHFFENFTPFLKRFFNGK